MYELLKGMRVVEAAAFIAGPSCGLHLAQMGADVIRIDQIGGGPDFRRWPLDPVGGASLYWEGLNKAKRSVALDLSRPEGRDLAARIATAPGPDGGLFVTNFPVEGFLAYERLKTRRADLICVRVMGWPDGRPAVDYTVNSAVGLPLMTGPAGDDTPVNHVLPAWDLIAGAYAAFAVLSGAGLEKPPGMSGGFGAAQCAQLLCDFSGGSHEKKGCWRERKPEDRIRRNKPVRRPFFVQQSIR